NNFAQDFPVLLQQYWEKLGVDAKLTVLDFTSLNPRLEEGNFDVNAQWIGDGIRLDPEFAFVRFSCDVAKPRRDFCDKDIQKLRKKATATTDTAERKAVYDKLLDRVDDNAIIGGVVLPDDVWVSSSSVTLPDDAN